MDAPGAIRLTGFWSSAFFLVDPVVQALRLRSVETIGRASIPFPTRSLQDVTPDAAALADGVVVLLALWLLAPLVTR